MVAREEEVEQDQAQDSTEEQVTLDMEHKTPQFSHSDVFKGRGRCLIVFCSWRHGYNVGGNVVCFFCFLLIEP